MRKTPVTLGIIAMVFGGLQAVGSLGGLVAQPYAKQMAGGFGKAFSSMPKREGQPDVGQMLDRLGKVTEELKVYTYVTEAATLVLAAALFAVGWLLYKRRTQARPLSIGWAIAALAYMPAHLYVMVRIVQPRTMEVMRQMMPANASAAMPSIEAVQTMATVIFYVLFHAPLPIVLLTLMGRSSAKNDLIGPAPLPM